MKAVTGITHVALRVKDIDRSLDFYTRRLGFPELMRLDQPDGRLWLVYLRVTDTQFLELFPDAEGDRAPGAERIGLNHLCLEVSDIDLAVDELSEAGIPLYRPRKLGADRNLQAWIEDPDGNRIELMQMAPDGMQAEALARMRQAG